ncbi:MAG: hypothetical protein CMJ40_03280 [Phycisphaerae bacterium]|nr:hypothetical protein [Phycisphaerae bacterium]|tara:strand:+ start:542 stop:1621 length:1080 start_codon:yes stop_codon:yes gene_type:complete
MKHILSVRGDQAEDILGILKCVATAEGALDLHEIHKATLEAVAHHLFQMRIDVAEFKTSIDGAGERITDAGLRKEIMNMAGILPFLEEENMETRIDAVAHLGAEFKFSRRFARELHGLCHHAIMELTICMLRPASLTAGRTLAGLTLKFAGSAIHADGSKKTLERYKRYEELDDHIFAKVLTKYYRDNNFELPGTPHAPFSNGLMYHDMHHVLQGYPTTPLGETCVLAFDEALIDEDLGKALIAYVAQFQVGLLFDSTLPLWKNQFKPDIVLRAYERGGICNTNFLKRGFDWSELLEQPLQDVRDRFNIPLDGAIVKGPDDLWCGDMGIVGQRDSKDMVHQKKRWLEKIFAKLNVKSED